MAMIPWRHLTPEQAIDEMYYEATGTPPQKWLDDLEEAKARACYPAIAELKDMLAKADAAEQEQP